jgi:hypothetical protein
MIAKLNTNLIPIFNGTYETEWEVEEWDDQGEEVPVDYNQQDLMKSIAGVYHDNEKQILEALAVPFIKSIHFTGGTHSPREYNFSTDTLDFDLNINKKGMLEALAKLAGNEEFEKWLHECFTSYDGFMSFTPNNYKELSEEIRGEHNEFDQALSAMIRFLAGDDSKKINMDMYEEWSGNGYNGLDYKLEDPEV